MREGFDIFIENLGKLSVGKEVRRRKSEESEGADLTRSYFNSRERAGEALREDVERTESVSSRWDEFLITCC
jgi:hypothetical protein